MRVASSREDAWIETSQFARTHDDLLSRPPARTRGLKQILQDFLTAILVASSREDAWIETQYSALHDRRGGSRPPARTRGLKQLRRLKFFIRFTSRPPARTRGLKHGSNDGYNGLGVASSREDRGLKLVIYTMTK